VSQGGEVVAGPHANGDEHQEEEDGLAHGEDEDEPGLGECVLTKSKFEVGVHSEERAV
jgi:hypothetical protein